MDSETLLGLAGIGGTLLGSVVGATGALRVARINTRSQADLASRAAQRQVYAAFCATVMAHTARTAALQELLDAQPPDPDALSTTGPELVASRDAVVTAAAAVAIEGPPALSTQARAASTVVRLQSLLLQTMINTRTTGQPLTEKYRTDATTAQLTVNKYLDTFTEDCQLLLHPQTATRRDRRKIRLLHRIRPW
ncbi:hypothetical protein [Streptomyces yangpuensis]|uniref:hypothetical protein n=1 Tax=Streptomyces yangpuensis TaxID=1648182 RepID=UPI00062910A4|nr:hypothetical protein [Streptomyces yangpuensis]